MSKELRGFVIKHWRKEGGNPFYSYTLYSTWGLAKKGLIKAARSHNAFNKKYWPKKPKLERGIDDNAFPYYESKGEALYIEPITWEIVQK